ncbi:hypothetical protein BDV34DRAFT_205085 [Aspergillus parasiticus]|uniref:Uncharacterized protein n=1 Tax=Aspergillus parasiticus TaxID=5067 RepID=A0A5N6D514_ASPPA|nr:hypothetical protein BDV34DRAFT_205085 [Aspergillus parasiticus]
MSFIFSSSDGIGSLGLFLVTSSAPLPTGADLFPISPDRSFILTGIQLKCGYSTSLGTSTTICTMFLTGIIVTKVYEVQGYSPGIFGGKKGKGKRKK